MSMEWVRKNYKVPARRGCRVVFMGEGSQEFGTVRSARNGKVYIKLDRDEHARPFHPTWQLKYLT